MQSLYWVFTLKCNDRCEHCYNNSSPTAEAPALEDLLEVVPNLPDSVGRVILSGGEPTVEMKKLAGLVAALREKYGPKTPLMIQSNGDLLDDTRMQALVEMGIDRIDIVSMDRFHKQQGSHRQRLEDLFSKFGWVDANGPLLGEDQMILEGKIVYAFWGANEEIWLGGNWARGRALEHGHAFLKPEHNFCALWSGARGFLDESSPQQELHVQLTRVYPCCPTTYRALGDARHEPISSMLERARSHPVWQTLNRGEPGDLVGPGALDPAFAKRRIEELGDVCLWCDEFFRNHAPELSGPIRPASQRTSFDV